MTSHLRLTSDQDRFTSETERFRRELLAHCYRMVGSVHDAEDLVQETFLRAWRSYSRYEGRASIRSWLYAIATNVCLTALKPRPIRVLPSGLVPPNEGADRPPRSLAKGEVSWLEPIPDTRIGASEHDPAEVVIARESIRLALVASLQHLPSRQRAILVLREVLNFSAAETADILDTTTAAVKSGLQRARARLDERDPTPTELLEPSDERARALLASYIAAFERSDVRLLQHVLRADATLEATPFRDWQSGRTMCLQVLDTYVLGSPGDWRMIATTANGQPAAVVYRLDSSGTYSADGVVVLTATSTGISRVTKFHDPVLAATFGFPLTLKE
ncbi:sigma-70 family RNA polymerase sigma factor [Paractinoplanes maris]|uniref:sigma-70 family RNA polymerase sigma factor n=1 Tax=Paractinoplanes maris TaxID=1734446 RepID=UPI002020D8BB|nr:sigma-70 family RNA polymerase sigma factor [Actinoplanes maris]